MSVRMTETCLKVGCFEGTDRSQIADNAEFKTHMPVLPEGGIRSLRRHLRQSIRVASTNTNSRETNPPARRESHV